MTETKWTPGPWKVGGHPAISGWASIDPILRRGLRVLPDWEGGYVLVKEADAHLIAASPEMYDALFGLFSCFAAKLYQPDPGQPSMLKDGIADLWIDRTKVALAKARGEAQ